MEGFNGESSQQYDFLHHAEQDSLFGSPIPDGHEFAFPELNQAPVEAAGETDSTPREVEGAEASFSLTLPPPSACFFPSKMDFPGLLDLAAPASGTLVQPAPQTAAAASTPSSYPETYLAHGLYADKATAVLDAPFTYLTQPLTTSPFAPAYPPLQPLLTHPSQWPWQPANHGAMEPPSAAVFQPRSAPAFRPGQPSGPTSLLTPSSVFAPLRPTSQPKLKGRQYTPAPPSQPWGGANKQRKHMFEYSRQGVELQMDVIMEQSELLYFMTGPSPNRLHLTLWIQNAPFQVNHRYHHGSASSKCRYVRCPDKRRSILKGFWRVALDERTSDDPGQGTPEAEDPYLNAGYMHLYCFEQIFDLALLMRQSETTGLFRVAPDTRHLPYEEHHKNRMSLVRDSRSMLDTFTEWRKEEDGKLDQLVRLRPETAQAAYGAPNLRRRRREDRLWFRLTKRHLELEVQGRQKARDARGGADIAKHMGDVQRYLELKKDGEKAAKLVMGGVHEHGLMLRPPLRPPPETPVSPVEEVEQRVHTLQVQPHTRKRSAAAAHLVEAATSRAVTRRISSALAPLVASEPEHKRRRLEDLINRRAGPLPAMQPAKSRAVERYAEKVETKDGFVKRFTSIPM